MNVYSQQNAWMDRELNMQWLHNTLFLGEEKNDQEKVIFADNVGFQQFYVTKEIFAVLSNVFVYVHA